MFHAEELLDLAHCPFPELFSEDEPVWEILRKLSAFLNKHVRPAFHGKRIGTPYIAKNVQIGKGTIIEHGAVIQGPAIIGENCQIRAGAYLRENVIVGNECVLGNACEFKNAMLFDNVQVPHFSYVGDSVLGYKAHLGAGVILSNVKSTAGTVTVRTGSRSIDTGRRKFGAIIGDGADIGCNCVLSPGSIIGRHTILYPNILWRGVCPADRIVKLRQEHEVIRRRA